MQPRGGWSGAPGVIGCMGRNGGACCRPQGWTPVTGRTQPRYSRPAAVAGSWYPADPDRLAAEVDGYLAAATLVPLRRLVALVSPHAGLRYSGAVAGHAYAQLRNRNIELVVLIGPSHFQAFEGVAVCAAGVFETPLGPIAIDDGCAQDLIAATTVVTDRPAPHAREHSLELQLPFLRRAAPGVRIVPLLMGEQSRATALQLGESLSAVLERRRAVVIASSDLSHYHDAATAHFLDAVVLDHVGRADPDGLQRALERNPGHACGGGPIVAALRVAVAAGVRGGLILDYADSGDVSGDTSAVVGYVAAAFGLPDA
jgi:AmmeMemoRadiSam system protein B